MSKSKWGRQIKKFRRIMLMVYELPVKCCNKIYFYVNLMEIVVELKIRHFKKLHSRDVKKKKEKKMVEKERKNKSLLCNGCHFPTLANLNKGKQEMLREIESKI